ncbi:MAG: hypothetical protein HYX78_10410 [Armatimonadetes bacterium]|nr:hypothetical protein [Armatimonadota bacterium]
MYLNAAIPVFVRMARAFGSEVTSSFGAVMHAAFLRRNELWLTDMLKDRERLSSLRGAVLVFAPAVGEVTTVDPLLRMLVRERPDLPLLICVTTSSGLASCETADFSSVRITSDSRRLFDRLIRALSPRGMMIVQVAHAAGLPTNLVAAMAANGLPMAVVNGYLPARDMKVSTGWAYRGLRRVYKDIDVFCVQTEEDAERLASLGAEPERIVVAGNMKFDAALLSLGSNNVERLAEELGLDPKDPLVVAGSTHPGEDRIVLEAFREVISKIKSARLVIAPRRIKKAEQVAKLASGMGFSVALRSGISGRPQVIVLDTVGELRPLYGAAWVAFVGGTMVPIGGHNVLEPAVLRKPVVFGPYVHHTSGAAELLLEDGGALCAETGGELARVLMELLENADLRRTVGDRALASVRSRAGATEICARVVTNLLLEPGIPPTSSVLATGRVSGQSSGAGR